MNELAITVSWVLIDNNKFSRDKDEIKSMIAVGHPIKFINDKVIEMMNECDMLHHLAGYTPLYQFTLEQWNELRKIGVAYG
jgi:hypothetical protein